MVRKKYDKSFKMTAMMQVIDEGKKVSHVDTTIIQSASGKRYYFKIGDYKIAEGLGEDSQVLDCQGG